MFRKSSPEPTSPAPRMERSERREQSFLQGGVKIDGDLTADGDVRIEGQLVGTAKVSGMLTIGPKAEIDGVFTGSEVVVHGQLRGTIHAKNRVHLAPGAKVTADLYCSSLVIEDGVYFHGSSNMGDKASPKSQAGAAAPGLRADGHGAAGSQVAAHKEVTVEARAGAMPPASSVASPSAGSPGAPKPGFVTDRTPASAGIPGQGGRDGQTPGLK